MVINLLIFGNKSPYFSFYAMLQGLGLNDVFDPNSKNL